MIYLATPTKSAVAAMRTHGHLGYMMNPGDGRVITSGFAGILWAADNGCFADNWQPHKWHNALVRWMPNRADCLFAVVPDVVANFEATRHCFDRYADSVRDLGYKLAFVAQDGGDENRVPWDGFDCLFVGGTDRFKLGEGLGLAAVAHEHGKWAHLGRANSRRRVHAAWSAGFDSSDGTFLKFGPDVNLPRLLSWFDSPPMPLTVGGS